MFQRINLKSKFEHFLLLFIICQPILDLLTSFCILQLNMSATLGVLIRFLIMTLSIIYLLIKSIEIRKWNYLIYLIGVALICGAGIINNILIKTPILLGEEVKFVSKSVYYIIMLFTYFLALNSMKAKENIYIKTRDYIVYATLIMNITILISIITGTDYNSYPYSKIGSKGWFYAANELGSILGVTFPIVVLYSIEKTTSIRALYYWIPTILSIFSSFAIGTKVGYFSVVFTIIVAILISFIQAFAHKKQFLLNSLVVTCIGVGIALTTSSTPFVKNMAIHQQELQTEAFLAQQRQYLTQEQINAPASIPAIEGKKSDVENMIFSSRELFIQTYKKSFKEVPMSQKLLGMGYGGILNYPLAPKLIERDFHDWFYTFGVIGFIFMVLPVLYYCLKALVLFMKDIKSLFTIKYVLMGTGIVLSVGIAFISGHVLTAPGVSIYFIVILATFLVSLSGKTVQK
ncbi:O-antigen ligase family protein [Microbacteriaceae bacterium 4G12]